MARPTLNDEERTHRRAALLDAALALFRQTGGLPSVAQIAERAGVAKGSVYLWFATREEIFVALLQAQFEALLLALAPVLLELPGPPTQAAASFAQRYARLMARSHELLHLAGMANAVLERNLPLASVLAFKRAIAEGLVAAADALQAHGTVTDREQGIQLLLRTWSLTLGLWQTLDVSPEVRPHLAEPPLSVFRRDFAHELEASVAALWRGHLA